MGHQIGPGASPSAWLACTPCLSRFERRQALWSHREAADQGIDAIGASMLPSPPRTPRSQRLRRLTGKPERAGGRPIAFSNARGQGRALQPVDGPDLEGGDPHSTKASGRFATLAFPRIGPVCPRVGLVLPHGCFWARRHAFTFLLLFSEGERGEGDSGARRRASTGRQGCNKVYPRVGAPIHVYSVDGFLCKGKRWCGFAGVEWSIHASTGGNAPVPSAGERLGGRDGRD